MTAALMTLASAGCGGSQSAQPQPTATVANNPVLDSAAAVVTPALERSFPATFAGITLDQANDVMVVYRRPDPALDARVRALAPDVRVEFREARYSLAQMRTVVARVGQDESYWRGQGISITAAFPRADGTGVEVQVAQGGEHERQLLAARYPEVAIFVSQGTVVHPTAGVVPPIEPGGTTSPSR